MKKKLIFFFISFTLITFVFLISKTQVKFKNFCLMLTEFSSQQVDLNKLDYSIKKNIKKEINLIGKNLNNFIRLGDFRVITSSANNKCLNDVEFINQKLNNLNKVFKENFTNNENYKIIVKSTKIDLTLLFLFLVFLLYLSMTIFLVYLLKLFFDKKNLK